MTDKLILWHPVLFAIIFVIMPFTQYAGLIPYSLIVVPFVVICTFTLIFYLIIKYIVKKADVAIAVLSPMLIFFLGYGILHQYISDLAGDAKLRDPLLILAILVTLIIIAVYIVKIMRTHKENIKKVNKACYVIAVAIIIYNAFSITAQSIATAKIIESSRMTGIPLQKHTGPFPDIYFVILDEYAAPSQMKSYFQYDMMPFVEYLRQKGFMVTEMTAEGIYTLPNMEARLNMEARKHQHDARVPSSFLGNLCEVMNILNACEEEQQIRIRNSNVFAYIKSIGYQFITMGYVKPQMIYNRFSDRDIKHVGVLFANELSSIIVVNSALRVLINRYTFPNSIDNRLQILDSFSKMEQMPVLAGKPKFVYAHVLCPHSPYIFGANGEILRLNSGGSKGDKQLYIDQHIFITKKTKELVDQKLLNSHNAPVIIIQADHGARMDKTGAHQIFSAVYIPNQKGKPWQNKISHINTFRLLFNELFGLNLEIL